jgi:neutral ceramidase
MTGKIRARFGRILLAAALALPVPFAAQEAEAGELSAAARRVDVTPAPGTPLGGYGGGRRRLDPPWQPDLNPFNHFVWFRPYEGVHDPVFAKILLLDDGHGRVLIVGLDTIGATERFRRDVAAHAARFGIPESHVFVSGTHTHGGPGALADQKFWWLVAMDVFDNRVYSEMLGRIRGGIDRVVGELEPASVGIGRADAVGLQRNRRGHPGRFDPELGVVSVQHRDGRPLALLFNLAVHGVAVGDQNLLVTRDLMGYAEDRIEAALGGGVAIFLNGAEGDVAPEKGGFREFEAARWSGERLADQVLALLPSIQTKPVAEIDARSHRVVLPPAYVRCDDTWDSDNNLCAKIPDRFPDAWRQIKLDGLVDPEAQFHALRIDGTVLATVPGEPITNIGLAIKAGILERGYEQGFVLGCTNGHISYITTEEEYHEGGYESLATLYGPRTGEIAVEASLRAVDLLDEPASATVRVRP